MDIRIATDWERALVTRLQSGDEAALGEMYDQYAGFVFGLAARVIGDRVAAEDVTQEVFLSLWEKPAQFDATKGRLRTFLGTLAHRRAVDYVRREQAKRRRANREAALAHTVPDVDEMAMAFVAAERVREAVSELPVEQRDAIQLAYFGGRTYRQVAIELGIPEGTAKSRLRLGLNRIAEVLVAQEVELFS